MDCDIGNVEETKTKSGIKIKFTMCQEKRDVIIASKNQLRFRRFLQIETSKGMYRYDYGDSDYGKFDDDIKEAISVLLNYAEAGVIFETPVEMKEEYGHGMRHAINTFRWSNEARYGLRSIGISDDDILDLAEQYPPNLE